MIHSLRVRSLPGETVIRTHSNNAFGWWCVRATYSTAEEGASFRSHLPRHERAARIRIVQFAGTRSQLDDGPSHIVQFSTDVLRELLVSLHSSSDKRVRVLYDR
jgi:predicted MarR family transcription regulator